MIPALNCQTTLNVWLCFVKLYINVIWAKCHSHRTPWHFNQTSRGKQQERDESTIAIRKLSLSKIKDCANSAVAFKAVRNINRENTHTHVESQIRFIELEGGCVNGVRVRMSLISQDLLRTWARGKEDQDECRTGAYSPSTSLLPFKKMIFLYFIAVVVASVVVCIHSLLQAKSSHELLELFPDQPALSLTDFDRMLGMTAIVF